MSPVPFRRLALDDEDELRDISRIVELQLRSGQLILGEGVERFEAEFARFTARGHCVGVSDGTSALYLALKGFGVQAGHEVIVPALSWVATATAVVQLGAIPVFVDVDQHGGLCASSLQEAINSRTRAVVAVDFFGRMANLDRIEAVCATNNVILIEDAAQSSGAELHGRPAGSFGSAASFSFNPMKVLPAAGEAGAVVLDDAGVHEQLMSLRYLGTQHREICASPELNHKIDPLQAQILLYRMQKLKQNLSQRRAIAMTYTANLHEFVDVPESEDLNRNTFFDYPILTPKRDALQTVLTAHGVDTRVKPLLPLNQHPAFTLYPSEQTPMAEYFRQNSLCLPIYRGMKDDEVGEVIQKVRDFFD